ncbi:MAG TPA: hypothetical protein VFJ19_11605 [Nocardioidaceae bacterium]|nr:hypothetical protein [Nocardioidaceae bacterium]
MTTRQPQRRRFATSPFSAPPTPVIEQFAVHDRVTHDLYGLGVVLAEEAAAVTVDFGDHRVRIASPFTKLTKL